MQTLSQKCDIFNGQKDKTGFQTSTISIEKLCTKPCVVLEIEYHLDLSNNLIKLFTHDYQ